MKLSVNKYSVSEEPTVEDKVESIEQYLSQFTSVIIDVLSQRSNFRDQFDAQVKEIQVNGSGSYTVSTGVSRALGGIVLRSSQGEVYPTGHNIRVEGSDIKMSVTLNKEEQTTLTVVIFFS